MANIDGSLTYYCESSAAPQDTYLTLLLQNGVGLENPERSTNEGLTMYASIDNLKEISHRCRAGEPLNQDLADWLGNSLQGYLDRRYCSFEEAFGLIFPRGGVSWWREEAMRVRDAALRDFAEIFLGDLATGTQARKIWTA